MSGRIIGEGVRVLDYFKTLLHHFNVVSLGFSIIVGGGLSFNPVIGLGAIGSASFS